MPYKATNNEYIIENDVEESDNLAFQKEMKRTASLNDGLPEGYEIDETPVNPNLELQRELQEEAAKEGLVSDEEYLGGKGASPEEVIAAMKAEGLTQGAQEKEEEYQEKKFEEFKTITATRDLLFSRAQETVTVKIPMVVEMKNPETGKIEKTPVNAEFKVKRLTEAENTHILNHKLIGKELSEMTDEEYVQSSKFRSKVLEKAVIEPKLTAQEWQTQCSNADINALYDEVNKVLTEADDVSLFQ